MASAQVLPNSGAASARKQGHLEAGKRRNVVKDPEHGFELQSVYIGTVDSLYQAGRGDLEEFRKKKAARKAASAGQVPSTDSEVPDNRSLNEDIGQLTSDRIFSNAQDPSSLGACDNKKGISSQLFGVNFIDGIETAPGNGNDRSGSSVPLGTEDEGHGIRGSSGFLKLDNGSNIIQWGRSNALEGREIDQVSVQIQTELDPVQTNLMAAADVVKSKSHSQGDANSIDLGDSDNHSKCFNPSNTSGSVDLFDGAKPLKEQVAGVGTESSSCVLFSANDDPFIPSKTDQEVQADNMRWKISDSINFRLNVKEPDSVMPEYSSVDYASGFKSSTQHSFPSRMQGNATVRSRPSFLDSINVSCNSSAPDMLSNSMEIDRTMLSGISNDGEVQKMSTQQSSKQIDTTEPSVNGHNNTSNDLKVSLDKDNDFAALEQHIEDLTRQKFALQRALDTSQSLAESLASENSSLTESFNQQGKAVNQLKPDMERLQEEIKAQLLAFESLKLEYANVQLECNAADERAKILASEIINLEEKALRLRSNELKLEKQLENSNVEITSYKQKLSIREKDSNDLRSTIDALQEEKKLLQAMLRKASAPEKAVDRTNMPNKKDMCTSTNDLGDRDDIHDAEPSVLRDQVEGQGLTNMLTGDASTSSFQDVAKSQVDSEKAGTIPHDHIRMIDNIDSLLSELMLEKEALMQALTSESSLNCKLKDLNKELSLKLEAQTQRFELLAAQKMAIENVPLRPSNPGMISEATEYTDEGDEVVERVLGWIMKLFPGGPGKRRARRLS